MMQQYREPLIEVCQVLAEKEHLEVTIRKAATGALVAGAGAFMGALFGGPVGLAVGGTLASVTTAVYTKGTYRSVGDILKNDLTPAQKRKLASSVKKILNNIKTEDVVTLTALIATQSSVKEALIKEIGSFLLKELNMKMITK